MVGACVCVCVGCTTGGRICGPVEARYIWAVAARYIWALAQDTIPRFDTVTRRSLPFTAPLADFPSLSKWYHFNGMFCSKKDPFDFLGFLRG